MFLQRKEKNPLTPRHFFALGVLATILIGGAAVWATFVLNKQSEPATITDTSVTETVEEEPPIVPQEPIPLPDLSEKYPQGSIRVDWYKGGLLLSEQETTSILLAADPTYAKESVLKELGCEGENVKTEPACNFTIFEVGIIKEPARLAGSPIYDIYLPVSGMGIGTEGSSMFINPITKKMIDIDPVPDPEYPNAEDWWSAQLNRTGWFEGKIIYYFAELTPRPVIALPDSDHTLQISNTQKTSSGSAPNLFHGPFAGSSWVTDIKNYPTILGTEIFPDPFMGAIFFKKQFFYALLPNGSAAIYEFSPSFLVKIEGGEDKYSYRQGMRAEIEWNNPKHATEDLFEPGGNVYSGGCGAGITAFTDIVTNEDWFHTDKLSLIGKTKLGDSIYELTDKKTNSYYQEIFDYGYSGSIFGDPNKSEEEREGDIQKSNEEKFLLFLEDAPLFFWKDPFGNWRVYKKAKYTRNAECGKPVIYLYPEQEMDARVEVAPNLGFTKTEPLYPRGGWRVKAKPNGELYSYDDQKTYPYLFWEGHADGFSAPKEGFVLAKDDIHEEMIRLLKQLGLNEQETKDFLEFWEPKMTTKPYVFVTFVPQDEFEKGAPLRVTPKPDTVIRVFMDFHLLDAPIEVEPLPIQTPKRDGFTVVEWGGVLRQ